MPVAFASLTHAFVATPEPSGSDPKIMEEVVNSGEIKVGIIQETPNMTISFTLEKTNLVSGKFEANIVDGNIFYEISGVFQVNSRSNYVNAFLHEDSRWQLDSLGRGDIGEFSIEGLETETYSYMRFGEEEQDIRYLVNIMTSKLKKDLV